jgi:hypothetical protein
MDLTAYEDSDPLEGLSEEEIQQLMELGVIPSEQDALAQRLAEATAIRKSEGPQGRNSGRVYTAASPIEHAVHAFEGIQARKDIDSLTKKQQDLLDKQVAGRGQFLRAMYGKKPPIPMAPIDPESFKMPTVNF